MGRAAEVAVVGGGVMGCGIALRLAQAGARAVVFERGTPGAEASSAAAGILGAQSESDGPGPFFELCLRSRALYPDLARELRELTGIDIGYLPSGVLQIAFEEADLEALKTLRTWQRERGLRAQLLSLSEARALEPEMAPRAVGALHFPDDHQVDNQLLAQALASAAVRAGAELRTGEVLRVTERGGRATGVVLRDGQVVEAQAVVIAAGSWSGLIEGVRLRPGRVQPARGQMLQLRAPAPLFRHVLFSRKGYLVPRADGRVIAGSTMEWTGFEKAVTAGGLHSILRLALDLYPALEQIPVQQVWSGLRPFTEDRLPVLGPGPLAGLYLATGHFRNGILLAPITAELMCAVVLGKTPSVDLKPFRPDRP